MLRRINLLYISLPLVAWGLWSLLTHLHKGTVSFYGFAENKETGINLDHDIMVQKIHAKPGQFVRKGALLMEVTRLALDLKMSEISYNMNALQSEENWRRADILAQIDKIQAEKEEKTGNLQSELRVVAADYALHLQLLQSLGTLPATARDTQNAMAPYQARMAAIREEMSLVAAPYERETERLKKELRLAGEADRVQSDKLQKDLSLYHQEEERLKVYAPSDGLVGYVHCKEGEHISAFTTLISFYEQSPNMVIGYIHESLSLQLHPGDSIVVSSTLRPGEQLTGVISGMGHRIVEIPERLRKIPELRTYGREVLIDIPASNPFLQKEKVMAAPPGQLPASLNRLFSKK